MTAIRDAIPEQVERTIREVLEPHVEQLGIEDIRIEPGEDHDGDPVIYVRLKHRLVAPAIRVRNLIAIEGQLRDRAWDEGERRFVHVEHDYDEKQDIAA